VSREELEAAFWRILGSPAPAQMRLLAAVDRYVAAECPRIVERRAELERT